MSVAVFVDAGYLFAQGSVAISGEKRQRHEIMLNETAAIAELTVVAREKSDGQRLLRVYWYDAARNVGTLTLDHARLAHADHVKLRLGYINSEKQQKGVDSLIITDLIELARNRALSDAVLFSGDEDLRIGVQIAQSYGVRVHLIGIKPSRGSQSPQLLQESDTATEWDELVVRRFLSVVPQPAASHATTDTATVGDTATPDIAGIVGTFLDEMPSVEYTEIVIYLRTQPGSIPSDVDRSLLAHCRQVLGRSLEWPEIQAMRRAFRARLAASIPSEQ